jgi:hypothetical protein
MQLGSVVVILVFMDGAGIHCRCDSRRMGRDDTGAYVTKLRHLTGKREISGRMGRT